MKQLSIIVPVYNVDKYLAKCLDSLVCQGLDSSEYEIIVVVDGATDGSLSIAEKYAEQFSQIKVIVQNNGGLSGARNTGMINAQGQYIQFVDSDDFLEPNVLRPLLDKMEKEQLDVLRFNYQNVNEQYEIFQPCKSPKKFVDYRDDITNGMTFLTERLGYACYACQFIFSSELILMEGNNFKKGIYFEDTEWTPRILSQTKRITSVDTIVYNYLIRQGSITQSVSEEKKRKLLADQIYIVEVMQQQMQHAKDQHWYKGMITNTVISLLGYVATDFYRESSSVITNLKSKKVFPLYRYHLTRRQKIHLSIVNLSPRLYVRIKHLVHLRKQIQF